MHGMNGRTTRVAGLVVALALCAAPGSAQTDDVPAAPNTVYLELLGSGLLYSVNFDRIVLPSLAMRAGLMYADVSGVTINIEGSDTPSPNNTLSLGLAALGGSYLYRDPPHRIEYGGTLLVGGSKLDAAVSGTETDVLMGLSGIVAYRYQPPEGGLFFRVAYTPIVLAGAVVPAWGGVSIGWSF